MAIPSFGLAHLNSSSFAFTLTGSFDVGATPCDILAMAKVDAGASAVRVDSIVLNGSISMVAGPDRSMAAELGLVGRLRSFEAIGHGLTGTVSYVLSCTDLSGVADTNGKPGVEFFTVLDGVTFTRSDVASPPVGVAAGGTLSISKSSNANSRLFGALLTDFTAANVTASGGTTKDAGGSVGDPQALVLSKVGTATTVLQGVCASAANFCGTTWSVEGAAAGPVITGPSGAAGAGSITTSTAENQNVAGVWTATGFGTWSLTGTDAALLSIAGGSGSTGTVTKATGNFDFDTATGGKSSYSFNVVFGAASQAVTLNISDSNEAPSFVGPAIGALVLTQGQAMTPVTIAAKFLDPEGLTITGSVVESLPTGLSVVSGSLQGNPTTPQAVATYTPRGADPAANGTNGTPFTIEVLAAAAGVTLSGPSGGNVGVASTNFTVGVTPVGGVIQGTLVVTPNDNSGGGSFSPTSVNLTAGSPTATFTYTPASAGAKTIGVTNNGGLTNPSTLTYTASGAAATAVTLDGPTTGVAGSPSSNFTVGANGVISGTVTVTPSATGCTFTPSSVNISAGSPTATFTCTAATAGAKSITLANNGSLTNPAAWTYTASSAAATTASFLITTDGTTPAANLSGLKFAFFDEATPDLWTAPKLKAANGSTNGSGVMTLNITGVTGLVVGQVGSVVATNSDGSPSQGASLRFTFKCVAVS